MYLISMKCKECGAIDHIVEVVHGAVVLTRVKLDNDNLVTFGAPSIIDKDQTYTEHECGACGWKYKGISEVVQLLKG